jgi:ATP-dependent Lon protease
MTNPRPIPVVPIKDQVVFPGAVTPSYIQRHRGLLALDAAMAGNKQVLLVTQRNAEVERPGLADLYEVGVLAEVIQVLRLPDSSAKILIEGRQAMRLTRVADQPDFLAAHVEPIDYIEDSNKTTMALQRTVFRQFERHVNLSEKIPEDLALSIREVKEPIALAHAIANYCSFKVEDKQLVLEALRASEKMRLLSELLAAENELLELENNIISQVKGKIGRSQKEYFLSEQLKVIEKELGLASEDDLELDEYNDLIAKTDLSDEARERALRELGRLAKMPQLSPEATVCRTYIEWITDLPWGKRTRDQADLARALEILNEDHYGLEKIKDRIVEYLAVLKLVKHFKGPILCLVGPPGVGKTSLARSVARTLKRKFVRVSLGGVRDEAEIRGHRRTYIGSMPGKVIQMMRKAGTMNPVFLLDEIDKLGSDFRGDPASALLEVLDPEQNKNFNDHYLEVDFDLSQVMFITTANTVGGIPAPLLDRMELIRLPGYTEDEKRHIAREFIIPRQMKGHGLLRRKVLFTDEAIDKIINHYTREAGVRNLDREIAGLCRKAARQVVETDKPRTIRIDPVFVRKHLGPERHRDLSLTDQPEIGLATGLAWTEAGGELLLIEATTMPGKGILQLTGQLGDVMKESGAAAMSYLRSRAEKYALPVDFHKTMDIHVHLPEGAIPKDGPSAGITLVTAILSALARRPIRRDIAMTGEVTLRGHVLKIGGLKEKTIAAHRCGIRRVIIPAANEPELEEISEAIRKDMEFYAVKTVDEVIDIAMAEPPQDKPVAQGSRGGQKLDKPIPAPRKRKDRIQPTA